MIKKALKNPWIKWPIIAVLSGFILVFGLYASVYLEFWGEVPTKEDLTELSQMQASQVYGEEGALIGKYYITNRRSVGYEDLPKVLTHALIATEDARFYEHDGVDKQAILRVIFKTILMGDESSGGGSTITMQLAKNLYGRKDYGFLSIVINKFRECIVAYRLEEVYSKHEILALYFNTVPFSGNTYGVETAAQKFFNVNTTDLSLSQAATLVGTLKANHSYNPKLFPERSQLRRDVVLSQMVKYGYISEQKGEEIMQQKIDLNYHNYSSSMALAPYFRQHVKQRVLEILAQEEHQKPDGTSYNLLTDGLKVYTTLNARLQKYAEAAMREHMAKLQKQFEKEYGANPPWQSGSPIVKRALKKLPQYTRLKAKGLRFEQIKDSLSVPRKTDLFTWEGVKVKSVSVIDSLRHYLKLLNTGMVSVDPNSGAIRAYIGGIDYRFFQYDHVYQSRREVGSTFKPFVYTAALENGLSPCDYFPVRAVTYADLDNWRPENAGPEEDPNLHYSLTAALVQSLNTIAVKVLRATGLQNVIDQVHKMGIDQDIPQVPSIALGVANLRVIDMAKAYTSYLNNGRPVEPFFIKRIEDKNGKVIYQHKPEEPAPKAFSERTREIMLEMLQQVVNKGTGRRLRTVYHFKNDLAGKTGTTQNNTDGWFVGMLPDLVTVVWVGHDNHEIKFRSTALGQGANTALPIFAETLQRMNKDPYFEEMTTDQFAAPSLAVQNAMDCPPTAEFNFFERLFGKGHQVKKEKKGFFERLFGGKKDKKSHKKEKKEQDKKKKKGFFERLFGG